MISIIAVMILSTGSALANPGHPRLLNNVDGMLQAGLSEAVTRLGLQRAVAAGTLSMALVDITDTERPRYAALNGDEMMYAASLPKIAILLGAFERFADGTLVEDTATRDALVKMIRYSSNQAASHILSLVGMPYLAQVLQSARYRLYDPVHNGGLWVGRSYGDGPAWKRDPLHNLSHGATAYQVARFYYMLETGRLVSPKASQQMKAILSEPAIHHKFVKGLDQARAGSRIYRKSGTWRSWHSDSAIVERDGRRYIAVALAKSADGGSWMTRIIAAMDDIVFNAAPARPLAMRDGVIQ